MRAIMTPVLQLNDVNTYYGPSHVLQNVTLEAKRQR